MKFKLWLFMVFVNLLSAGTIQVATAANMSYALPKIIEVFQSSHPKIEVKMLVGGSGKLATQIRNGAPFDIFLSANMSYPKALYEQGLSLEKPVIYAQGSLALFSLKKRNFSQGIDIVNQTSINKIAIANPKTAPYGVAAMEAFKNSGLLGKVQSKFVYGESISQTVIYATRVADLGVIAKSALFSPQLSKYKEGEHWKEVDSELYKPISQGMILLKNSSKNSEVKVFYKFLQSKEAKEILRKYGYSI